MTFGMFGSIFLLAQFFQVVQGYSPLQAGLRTLPWTFMPVIVAPIAGLLSTRPGPDRCSSWGWPSRRPPSPGSPRSSSPTAEYLTFVPAFIIAASGWVCSSPRSPTSSCRPSGREEEGKASGANNAIRELGGVFGVAVLAAVFTANGSYATPDTYVAGLIPAMQVGAVVVGLGALAAVALPGRDRKTQVDLDLRRPDAVGSTEAPMPVA